MKKIILSITILFSALANAQNEDPNLLKTWYLTFVQATDFAPAYTIADVNPPIAPTLTVSEGYVISGVGACNTFTGTFTDPGIGSGLIESQISSTTLECEPEIHHSVEQSYFGMLNSLITYIVADAEGGQVLYLLHPLMGMAVFLDYPLAVQKNNSPSLNIFPNPITDKISIMGSGITDVEIYNAAGQFVYRITEGFDNIDMSRLPTGIYLAKIFTDSGFITRKIVKN